MSPAGTENWLPWAILNAYFIVSEMHFCGCPVP